MNPSFDGTTYGVVIVASRWVVKAIVALAPADPAVALRSE